MTRANARAWLAAALLAALQGGPATPARADGLHPRGTAAVTSYSESMDTSIISTHATAGAQVPGEIELDAAWTADVISSASVDVITAATARVDDLRNQFGISAARQFVDAELDVDAGYAFSFERDSYSHIAHAGAQLGVWQDTLVFGMDYGLSYNRMGLREEPVSHWRPLWIHTVDLGATYIADPRTQLALMYSGGISHGYHANRYRRVPITWRQDLRATEWIDEADPDLRVRNAITLRAERALGTRWTASADYRFYFDTWGVVGHTLTLEGSFEAVDGLTFSMRARGAQQGAASFYKEIYGAPSQYRTRDRRLSPHLSGLLGLAVAWNVGRWVDLDVLELRGSVDALAYAFDDYIMPDLDNVGGAGWETLGTLTGLIAQIQIGVRP